MNLSFAAIRSQRVTHGKRSAMTLLEMIATLSLLLVLAVTAVRMLRDVTEIGEKTTLDGRARLAIERLADRVRTDAAESDSISGDQWPLTMNSDDGEIRYEFLADEHRIQRNVFRNGKPVAVDRFELPVACDPKIETDSRRVTIALMRRADISWTIEVNKP
ncbi:type II secretion system protein [Rubripirellula reticaptiva]|uniref:Prepilin-type N-terminal cleavage/methylation domain-containing protein n=1 Tax=Rubripirellula reticaptiva TaxID=2528013 RepID=A0A5C6EV70_9BACT|nr:hypothetical protein [Rubripirellula reticaptiva]TWU51359.1 hypothetical protein Poly59_29510 [Rubripirellula reticaptiva]